MQRRMFSVAIGLAFAGTASGQQTNRVFRVGVLAQSGPTPAGTPSLLAGLLRDVGYVEGQNIIVERRWAEGRNDRFPGFAAELVAWQPDVIMADSTPAAIAARRATTTIPIVMLAVSDPVGAGLVASLAHPGGNVTGSADLGIELAAKQLDLMHDLVPNATRIGVVMSDSPVHAVQLKEIELAATKFGLNTVPVHVGSIDQLEQAFESMRRQKAQAFILLGGVPFTTKANHERVVGLAATNRLPAAYSNRVFVEAGGLMSYGSTLRYRWKMGVSYVDQILKGARPADLPVQQPIEFELVINRGTARALGLTIPRTLLLRANQIIE